MKTPVRFLIGLSLFYFPTLQGQSVLNREYRDNGELAAIWFEMEPEAIQMIRFYPGGQMEELGNWYQGHLHGAWVQWNAEGQKVAEAHYQNGRKSGHWRLYNEYSGIAYDLVYDRDRLVGKKSGSAWHRQEQSRQ